MFNTLDGLLTELLDRGYERAARQTLQGVAASLRSGRVGRRLDELDEEALRLALEGERLRPDNPVLVALVGDLERELRRAAGRVDAVAPDVQMAGIDAAGRIQRGLALGTMDEGVVARLGLRWNTPDPETVATLVDYINTPAWDDALGELPFDVLGTINNQIVRGIAQGWGPERASREVRRVATGLAPHKANNLLRTLHLESYREATAIHQRANAGIARRQIRIEVLDQRTCLACIALHGTEMEIGERVIDHHQGRGTSVIEVEGRPLNVQTGEEWFNGLTNEQRRDMAAFRRSPGKLEALESGRARLRDFVQAYSDPVFGEMLREGSLGDALGGGDGPGPSGGPVVPGGADPSRPDGGRLITSQGYMEDDPAEFRGLDDMGDVSDYLFANDGRPRAQYMFRTEAVQLDENARFVLDEDAFNEHLKSYVLDTRSTFESRTRLGSIVQSVLRDEHDISITLEEAERVINQDAAIKADAVLTLARAAGYRMTDAQRRRLNRSLAGEYLDMKFEITGDSGSFENAWERAKENSSGIRRDSAEYRRLKADWDRMEMNKRQGGRRLSEADMRPPTMRRRDN